MREQSSHQANGRRSMSRLVLWCFLAIIAFFLITEHRAHVFGALPYLLLLACPLMHLFMHGHHGGHGESDEDHTLNALGANGGRNEEGR